MASSIFGKPQGNTILQTIDQLKSASNGDVRAACRLLDNMGITRTLPNGRQVTASQLADMMQGKTPHQAFQELGMDYDLAQSNLR